MRSILGSGENENGVIISSQQAEVKNDDYYAIMEVSKKASPDEIKAAYLRLSKERHPDRNREDDKATEKFQDLNRAHEVLSDPKARAKYDRYGALLAPVKLPPVTMGNRFPVKESERSNANLESPQQLREWLLKSKAQYPSNVSFSYASDFLNSNDPAEEEVLTNIYELILANRLSYSDFEKDQIHQLAWDVIFRRKEITELVKLGVDASVYIENEESSEFTVIQLISEYIKRSHKPSYGHICIGLGEMQTAFSIEKKSKRLFEHEERFLVFILDKSIKTLDTFELIVDRDQEIGGDISDPKWIIDMGIRDLAWAEMVEQTQAYQDKNGNLSAKKLKENLEFISGSIRFCNSFGKVNLPTGEVFKFGLKTIYEKLILPTETKKIELEARKDEVSKIKVAQLNMVLKELKKILKVGAKEIMDLHTDQMHTKGEQDQNALNLKCAEIYQRGVIKIAEYQDKKEIDKNGNRIGDILGAVLKGATGGILGLLLTATVVGAAAWFYKDFRGSFYQTFFGTSTRGVLKKCREELTDVQERVSANLVAS